MQTTHKLVLPLQIVILIAGLLLLPLSMPFPVDAAQTSLQDPDKTTLKRIVLDPGHGGPDAGVKGPAGTLEKAVTLRLALLIENLLKGRYQVALTRSDDYVMSQPDRTSHANYTRAHLFISLHAAGSYNPAAGGLRIYYYSKPEIKMPPQSQSAEETTTPWRELHKPHLPASRTLAKLIQDRSSASTNAYKCTLQAAPVAVLAGADMPALLIEAGYLTNPTQEKNLNDNKYLFKLATAISQGIDDFFSNGSGKL